MRVAFLVHDFPKLSETFVLNQATGLIDRGHDVDIYTNRIHDPSEAHPDVETYGLWDRTYQLPETPSGLIPRVLKGMWLVMRHWHRNPALFGRSLNPFQCGLSALGFRLVYPATVLADKAPYDIIHSQFGTQSFCGMLFARVQHPRPALVTTFRGYDISTCVKQEGASVYSPLFREGDFFLANCEFFRQRAIELGCDPAQIRVHRSGLDCAKFPYRARQAPSDRGVHLVTTGRLVEKKGIEYAIRAVALLLPKYPDLRYSIIGDGFLRQPLQELINALNLNQAVHLLGWKNEQQIAAILQEADLFVAPSVTAADGNQDAPVNVLKEAMAMGMPVISTWHGGIPELVEHGLNGLLVPERDADALAAQIELLIQHPEQWEGMGQAGRAAVEQHYNLHHLNDQLVDLYQMLNHATDASIQAQQGLPTNLAGPAHPSVLLNK
ncbi:MAG: glycosyltransferase [Kaiparowitsia implicata GSE-PSE-MK54-09C]|jgi:colanic acid/amylovoran biosynthesis glycosyltransferase|nr:glycosyltransferase [Kaiparowitsia implicata GSE-PSE-MK54-09C]